MQQSKLDQVVNKMIDNVRGRDRGFVLDLAADARTHCLELQQMLAKAREDGDAVEQKQLEALCDALAESLAFTSIEVRDALPPIDEYQRPADVRKHGLGDTESFIAYAQRYGTPDRSLIFYNEQHATLTLDEQVDRGDREVVTLDFRESEDWRDWSEVLGRPKGHRELLNFLVNHEHTLDDAAIIEPLRTLRMKSTVNIDSDVQDTGDTIGIVFNTNGNEELKKFRRVIPLRLPVLEQDVDDADRYESVELRMEVTLPQRSEEAPKFTLNCSVWRTVKVRRVRAEGQVIREALGDGWTVVHGQHDVTKRRIGRDANE